jgi:hypothetical protein
MKKSNPELIRKVHSLKSSLCSVCCFGLLIQHAIGQVVLSGVLQQGAQPANGQSEDSPIWNTVGNDGFANIYLTQPNGGYTAPLLNSGNGDGVGISYNLGPGSYQFYYFVMGFWDNNPGTYGINLFFNSDNTHPGIAAYSTANTFSATPVQAGVDTLPLNGDGSHMQPAPGGLTFAAGGLSVTLTGYGYGEPGIFGGPALDRVGNLDSVSDGYLDSVGEFTLTVTAIPEPSLFTLGAPALCMLLFQKGMKALGSSRKIAPEKMRYSSKSFGKSGT